MTKNMGKVSIIIIPDMDKLIISKLLGVLKMRNLNLNLRIENKKSISLTYLTQSKIMSPFPMMAMNEVSKYSTKTTSTKTDEGRGKVVQKQGIT